MRDVRAADREATLIMQKDPARAVHQEIWTGPEGLQRMNRDRQFTVPDPDDFELVRHSTWAEDVLVTGWHLPPLAGTRVPSKDPDSATLIVVAQGRVHYWSDSGRNRAGVGTMIVVRGRGALRFSVRRSAQVIEIRLPASRLRAGIGDRLESEVTRMPETPTERVLLALAEYSLHADAHTSATHRSIALLALAALDHHLPYRTSPALRDQILGHIEAHLSDPELSPRTIAAAFGVSVRWVHESFTGADDTLGRHIRRRRIEVVAEQLSRVDEPPPLAELAANAGFSTRDRLARTFRAETGMTIREFRTSRVTSQ